MEVVDLGLSVVAGECQARCHATKLETFFKNEVFIDFWVSGNLGIWGSGEVIRGHPRSHPRKHEKSSEVIREVIRECSKHSSKMRFSLIFGSLGVWESGDLGGITMDNYWTTMGQLWDNYWITIFVAIYEEIDDFINFLVSGELGVGYI